MNFIGKEELDDNLICVCSKDIATELLEVTFGQAKYNGKGIKGQIF